MTYDCYCDGDPAEFYHAEMRKARKPHKCYECRCEIPVGETYEHVRGKWEGDVSTFKTCALCFELRQWALISVPCFCWNFGDLHENVRDMVDGVRRDTPLGFVFEWGRRIIKIQRRKYGQHWPRMHRKRKPWRSAADIAAEARP